jgi:GTP cyclohydrolase I
MSKNTENTLQDKHIHLFDMIKTHVRKDAEKVSDQEKMIQIEEKMKDILDILGLDLNDDSLSGTPRRVAKMYVTEIFKGLNTENMPKLSSFENKFKYGEMLVEKNISVFSTCEHHFLPIIGKAPVAYISTGKVIGLSKINRIVDYFARRPQVQERLTVQIVDAMKIALDTEDVACVIDAKHMCLVSRGIKDITSSTITSKFTGKFKDPELRKEFFQHINLDTQHI